MENLMNKRQMLPGKVDFLGKGTYNCVFSYTNVETKEEYAFRLSLVPLPQHAVYDQLQKYYEQLERDLEEYEEQNPEPQPASSSDWWKLKVYRRNPRGEISFWSMHLARWNVFLAERGIPPNYRGPKAFFPLHYRARAILEWLQTLRPYLGPALLATRPWKSFPSFEALSEDLRVSQLDFSNKIQKDCPNLIGTHKTLKDAHVPYTWSVEKMERLEEWDPKTVQDFQKHMFGFLWFFMVLGSKDGGVGFRHHDIKPGNLLTRRYRADKPHRFRFILGNARVWEFESTSMGVVIDFDLSTLDISRRQPAQRHMVGTLKYAPPEAIIYFLYEKSRNRRAMNDSSLYADYYESEEIFGAWYMNYDRQLDADGYDQWALGMILLDSLELSFIDHFGDASLFAYAKQYEAAINDAMAVRGFFLEEEFETYSIHLFFGILHMCLIHGVSEKDPFRNCPKWFPIAFFESQKCIFIEAFKSQTYQAVKSSMPNSKPLVHFRSLLHILLAWDPKDRIGSKWLDDPIWNDMVQSSSLPAYVASWPPSSGPIRFSPQQLQDMQSRICAECKAVSVTAQCGAGCGTFYCDQQCADVHWTVHQCQNLPK